MKKILCFILMLALTVSMTTCITGCSDKGSDGEYMEISIACFDIANHVTHAESDIILKHVEDKFKIKIKPVNITRANFRDSLTLWAASNNLPDIMAGDASDTKQFAELARDGIISPIPQKMIDKYPNLKKYMEDEAAQTRKVDGEFYGIYRSSTSNIAKTSGNNQIMYRWDLAKAAGVTKEPATWDEFRDMIKKIQAKNKEITGLTTSSKDAMARRFMTYGVPEANSNALAIKWVKNNDNRIVPAYLAGDKLGDRALPVFELARNMYKEGTIDPDIAVIKKEEAIAKFINGQAAAIAVNDVPSLWGSMLKKWEKTHGVSIADSIRLLDPLPAYDGETYIWATNTGWSENYFSSKVSEEKMDKILELYDWLLSDEGFKITYYGFEGKTYNMTEEGPVYTPTALNDNPSISFWVQFTRWSTGFKRPEGFNEPRLDMPSIYEHLDELEAKFPTMKRQPGYTPEVSNNATNAYKLMDSNFVLTPEEDFIKIMTGQDSVSSMWEAIFKEYEKDGMNKTIDEVTKACK